MSQLAEVILIRKQNDADYPYYACNLNGTKIRDIQHLGEARIVYAKEIESGRIKLYRDFGKNEKRAFVKKQLPPAPKPTVAFKGPPLGAHTVGAMLNV